MKKTIFIITLSILIFISGCINASLESYLDNINIPNVYKVHHTYSYSSSGGDRSWNINYVISNEEFISCDGGYSFYGSGIRSETCTLGTLEQGAYPFNIHKTMSDILTELRSIDLTGFSYSKEEDIDCFSNSGRTICFNQQGSLVKYTTRGIYGGSINSWNLEGYDSSSELSEEREEL